MCCYFDPLIIYLSLFIVNIKDDFANINFLVITHLLLLSLLKVLPRFDSEDNIYKAHVMNVSWSADHRIVEGAIMAKFSNLWKSYLENPTSLIIDMK